MNDGQAHAESLRASLRAIHSVGHQALLILGVKVDYSQAEYDAFCNGFATFEYISLLVNPRQYDGTLAVKNTQELLIEPGELADLAMADRHATWPNAFPNTHGVIIDDGARRGETMKQLQARTIGAQVASEFQQAA